MHQNVYVKSHWNWTIFLWNANIFKSFTNFNGNLCLCTLYQTLIPQISKILNWLIENCPIRTKKFKLRQSRLNSKSSPRNSQQKSWQQCYCTVYLSDVNYKRRKVYCLYIIIHVCIITMPVVLTSFLGIYEAFDIMCFQIFPYQSQDISVVMIAYSASLHLIDFHLLTCYNEIIS